ncbi:MAG: HEAT repeat domain-containing protein, partial [Gammaproteobacteria bacterium]
MATKTLHAGDLDLYITLRPRVSGVGAVKLVRRSGAREIPVSVDCRALSLSGKTGAVIAAQPNSTWQEAQEFELGQTIFGTNDERSFVPPASEDAYQALVKGSQWFKFTFKESSPRLVYFTLDVLDREVPLDLELFQKEKDPTTGKEDLVPTSDGQFAYHPEATQNFPGLYKFRTRILKPGATYYIRVMANHPVYQLRTSMYEPPPYKDPRQAVRTGMDFLINLGDSWHANTPRRGSSALRNAMAHSETQLCIACHPTQFTTRGYLTAVQNGYPVTQRPALKFLTDRLYNNPRPLYGQEDTNWVRVIYSARTVASRIPLILESFEKNVSQEAPRPGVNAGFANYLVLHYDGLAAQPGEEADGCSPSISPFEIAAQSWQTFDLLARQTEDSSWRDERDQVEKLLLPAPVKTVIDLNWKITALATIDRAKYQSQIDTLVERLYSLQKDDGRWGYQFDPKSKASDFITFHALYALAMAGRRPETDPKMAKTLNFCLQTQRPEGSWQGDPIYKGFNTPFRDTQFAVMALSQLYPGKDSGAPRAKGWSAAFPPPPEDLNPDQADLFLSEADQHWDFPSEAVLQALRQTAATSDQPLVRQAAIVALGRVADPKAIEVVASSLGAPTKIVQTAAAWALREIAARRATGR